MKFSISHEGVIYATNPDGTVTKYGRIGSDGQLTDAFGRSEIGRASCRERVCLYV